MAFRRIDLLLHSPGQGTLPLRFYQMSSRPTGRNFYGTRKALAALYPGLPSAPSFSQSFRPSFLPFSASFSPAPARSLSPFATPTRVQDPPPLPASVPPGRLSPKLSSSYIFFFFFFFFFARNSPVIPAFSCFSGFADSFSRFRVPAIPQRFPVSHSAFINSLSSLVSPRTLILARGVGGGGGGSGGARARSVHSFSLSP